ncbi:MAG: hypothetical protein ABI386_03090 [Rhodanobacter sp.]
MYRLARWRNEAGNLAAGVPDGRGERGTWNVLVCGDARNTEDGIRPGNHDERGALGSVARSPIPVPRSWIIPPEVIERPPSAELRADQTDQDSLPPYDVLDGILERFIECEQSQAQIVAQGFDAETVRRVVRLVMLNEFKRRQSAPGPRVTTRAFGRERRYPITSGWH